TNDRQFRAIQYRPLNQEKLARLGCIRVLRFFITGTQIDRPSGSRGDEVLFSATCHRCSVTSDIELYLTSVFYFCVFCSISLPGCCFGSRFSDDLDRSSATVITRVNISLTWIGFGGVGLVSDCTWLCSSRRVPSL